MRRNQNFSVKIRKVLKHTFGSWRILKFNLSNYLIIRINHWSLIIDNTKKEMKRNCNGKQKEGNFQLAK